MAKILVTGGCGFIGSHLVDALVKRGDQVRVLDLPDSDKRENLGANRHRVQLFVGDVADLQIVKQAVDGVDIVFHQAALASVPRSVEDPLATHSACVTGTLVVLHAAQQAGVKRVVYAASSSAYGNQPTPLKKETDLPSPISPYAAAKLAAEHYCHSFYHSYGLETVSLRYFNVFGPQQDPNGPYAAVVPLFAQKLLAGQAPTIYGDGKQTRDFTYIDNVVQANLLASQVPAAAGQTFNVGSGQATSLLDMLGMLQPIIGTNLKPNFAPSRAGDVRDSLADISLARQVLGYNPTIDLKEGMLRTVAAMKG
ncbi:UDP-glucose 4-epimerase [Anatilimnocola aggregata]|uniref:UDP-glucose 4-epimerase n=1 Tax=Anatilimnocola aggregata TaxID=2528021 RepID=A0A517YKG4_9BACT|nr:SDR family oxidoreductase [Anatilimnocola aggregata]QDU30709.1 UDP-glucose 4-epimerase [Anatilimnocola aggregata]